MNLPAWFRSAFAASAAACCAYVAIDERQRWAVVLLQAALGAGVAWFLTEQQPPQAEK